MYDLMEMMVYTPLGRTKLDYERMMLMIRMMVMMIVSGGDL